MSFTTQNIFVCVLLQSVHPKLRIKSEGSAGKLQYQEQERRQLSCGPEDKSASAAGAQFKCPRLQGVEPL